MTKSIKIDEITPKKPFLFLILEEQNREQTIEPKKQTEMIIKSINLYKFSTKKDKINKTDVQKRIPTNTDFAKLLMTKTLEEFFISYPLVKIYL